MTIYFKYSVENAGLFDLVLLTEVIEHIDNISDFILALSKLLLPNGQIIMTTPNKSFYPFNTIWVSDLPPIHCWWLSEESIKYLSSKLGLIVSFIDFTDYYKNNYTPESTDVNKKITGRSSIFKENGELVKSKKKSFINRKFTIFFDNLIRTQFFKMFYNKLRFCFLKLKFMGKTNFKICGSQTYILCAILKIDEKILEIKS